MANIITKEYLIEEYINKNKSSKEISLELNVSDSTILNYLKKFNISTEKNIIDKDWLYRKYIIENVSVQNIS